MATYQRRPLVAGNWKMNGLSHSAAELRRIIEGARDLVPKIDVIVCPPATLVAAFAQIASGTGVGIGGQDCHPEPHGAFTGDIAAEMLKDAGACAVIVGHSERRAFHGETGKVVYAKVLAAWRAGLTAIVCIGEARAERDAGRTLAVVGTQLDEVLAAGGTGDNLVIAYEPVWAIGSGLTPNRSDVAQVHGFIRRRLVERYGSAGELIRVLYGGSVTPQNARELLTADNVDGALVGGASLNAEQFLGIARVYA
jgi:triosephosphate isomerase